MAQFDGSPPPVPEREDGSPTLAEIAERAGLRRVHMIAWRDLEDVEAGGSEIHASEVARHWAEAGLDVTVRTSYAQGRAPIVRRDGYRVIRRGGRYLVFPRAALSEMVGRHGPWDGMVEIWNGVPFFSPLWVARKPSIVFLHHVHAEMWRMVFSENPGIAKAGELLEARIAPLLYRRARLVTLAESSKRELVSDLGFRPERVSVVPPGVDRRFSPGPGESPVPLAVAVGRLVPVKRYDVLIRALLDAKERVPALEAVIVGEGYERPKLEELVRETGASGWISLPGHVGDDALLALYRRAWLLVSASAREGWGMTITEAAACGVPSVVTRISGHVDAVVDDVTGLLVGVESDLGPAIAKLLSDDLLRRRLGSSALEHAATFTWAATARGALEALAAEAHRKKR